MDLKSNDFLRQKKDPMPSMCRKSDASQRHISPRTEYKTNWVGTQDLVEDVSDQPL